MSKYVWLGVLLAFSFTFFFVQYSKNSQASKVVQIVMPTDEPDEALSTTFSGPNKIQVALILDTSNSMDGLIEQAKSQLWKLVNELTTFEKQAITPEIEIALYQYGNQGLSVVQGYVQQISPLSTDLDNLSEQLFSLTTDGGSEYCGWAIRDALKQLEWSKNPNDLKLIFIAGNEPFNQGPINFREICQIAKNNNISVNTIHCGDYFQGENELWKEGADLAGGAYMNIDHNDKVVHVATPYDDEILRLNKALNTTYIYYGHRGAEKCANQTTQDENAFNFSSANSRTRAFVKTKKAYKNSDWDLVDYIAENESLEGLDQTTLPPEVRSLNKPQLIALVGKKKQEREDIKKELAKFEAKVKQYVAEKTRDSAEKQTLDNAMVNIIKEQAKEKKFGVKK